MNKTKEVVINRCFGGFGLSFDAVMEYAKLSGFEVFPYTDFRKPDGHLDTTRIVRAAGEPNSRVQVIYYLKEDIGDEPERDRFNNAEWLHERDIPRDDVNLVKVVRKLKKRANGSCAELKIVKIPADVEFEIDEYDGLEKVAEVHRTWS